MMIKTVTNENINIKLKWKKMNNIYEEPKAHVHIITLKLNLNPVLFYNQR